MTYLNTYLTYIFLDTSRYFTLRHFWLNFQTLFISALYLFAIVAILAFSEILSYITYLVINVTIFFKYKIYNSQINLLFLYLSLKESPDEKGNVLEEKGGGHRHVQAPMQ